MPVCEAFDVARQGRRHVRQTAPRLKLLAAPEPGAKPGRIRAPFLLEGLLASVRIPRDDPYRLGSHWLPVVFDLQFPHTSFFGYHCKFVGAVLQIVPQNGLNPPGRIVRQIFDEPRPPEEVTAFLAGTRCKTLVTSSIETFCTL